MKPLDVRASVNLKIHVYGHDKRADHLWDVQHCYRDAYPSRSANGHRAAPAAILRHGMYSLRKHKARILAIGWEGEDLVVHWAAT